MTALRAILAVLPVVTIAIAGTATADDGRIEINQTCAVVTGCFAGDVPGFPVGVSAPGSYVLTSNLDLQAVGATRAIAIAASARTATLDLNGFEIVGAAPNCTGSGTSLSCSPNVGAHGIDAASAWLVTVRNGTVRNMQGTGVRVGPMGRVERILTRYNSADGITSGQQGLTSDCVAFRNGETGFAIAPGSVLSDSTSAGNGQFGVEAGTDSIVHGVMSRANRDVALNRTGRLSQDANACDDLTCARRGERSFYLTTTLHLGGEPLTACDAGFHMASLWEIHNPTELHYDAVRGPWEGMGGGYDMSQGPPGQSAFGWVRTGHTSMISGQTGIASCSLWTDSSGGFPLPDFGTVVSLSPAWNLAAEQVSPWDASTNFCNAATPVWCVED